MLLMRKRGGPVCTQKRHAAHCSWQEGSETLKQMYSRENPESAECVQIPIDSRNSAIHNAYRISLRPSSVLKPRHPSLKV